MAKRIKVEDFGALPEALYSSIVSFLPFKDAARTSILSKKWRPVWLATENIEFDESFFHKLNQSAENKEIQRRAFIDFMNNWIANYRQSTIGRLTLKFSDPESFVDDLTACIRFAIERRVKKLEIDLSDPTWNEEDGNNHPPLFDLPSEIYKHENLESLSMFSCDFRVVESEKMFGNLKHLSLGWIELSVCCFDKVMTYCKMLESLSLKRCWNLGNLQIKGQDLRLRRLVLDKCSFLEAASMEIEAPRLGFLKYSGCVRVFDLQFCRALEEVDLDYAFEEEHDDDLSNFICMLFDEIYFIRSLTVCSFTLQVIPNGDEPLGLAAPINVQHLTMNALMHPNEFFGIKFFLKSCPWLEKLTVNLGHGRALPDYEPPMSLDPKRFWTDNIFIYKCLKRTLKVVEINDFTGAIYEFCFMFYILSMARELQNLKIRIVACNPSRKEFLVRSLQSLRNFKVASRDICISIS